LDARVKAFMGLPADTDAARRELERVRDELGDITRRRDAVFEGLVERETPRKPRR
jgi:HAUS augmin-like complex subunit 1